MHKLKYIVPQASFMLNSFYALLSWLNISVKLIQMPCTKVIKHTQQGKYPSLQDLYVTHLVILRHA